MYDRFSEIHLLAMTLEEPSFGVDIEFRSLGSKLAGHM